MVGKTNVTGERLRSIIAVTYPEGSICTCVSGTKTLKARDTSGKALFNVTVGEWTVKAEDTAGKSKSVNVSITEEGQFESLMLNFRFMLFDNGEQCTEATGGWACSSDASIGTVLHAKTGNNLCWIYTKNKVDVSQYNTIGYQIEETSSTSKCALGLNTAQSWNGARSVAYLSNYETGTQYVDISGVTGEYYLGLVCDSYGGVTKCSKVWLE